MKRGWKKRMQKRLVRNKKELKPIRSNLRKNMPAPEVVLWGILRGNQLGFRFRRQYSIDNDIVDFCAPSIGLAIEIDGESHFVDQSARIRDKLRDQRITKNGIKVLRFTNREVMENSAGVIEKIIEELPPLNLPLNMGEKERGKSHAWGEG